MEENEPSVRYTTLTQLLDTAESEPLVRKTKGQIGSSGWAAIILEKQKEGTYWDNPKSCLVPKFTAGLWQLLVLADLGVSSKDPRIPKAVEHLLDLHGVDSGGFSLETKGSKEFEPHICATGNVVRALAKMGYAEDDRVLTSLEWLISKQLPDGGWNCYAPGKHGSFSSTIQPVWALSEMMSHNARRGWETSAMKGAEFLLKHRLFKSDRNDSVVLLDYLRIHYPLHYWYDFLQGLRVLTELGIKNDPRMNDAITLLLEKRLPDGKWNLDAVLRGWRHEHGIHAEGSVFRPEEREMVTQGWGTDRALQLEEVGKPSKWITLQALLALKRLGLFKPEH